MKYNYAKIGERIRENRKKIGKNQDDFIEQLKDHNVKIGRNTLSDIENGAPKQTISLDLLGALCEIFNCDIGYLLCEHDERYRVTADVCQTTGLSESAAQLLCDCKALSDEGLDEDTSYLCMINNLLESEMTPELSFLREAREYILIRFAADNTPVDIPIKDSDGYTVSYDTTTAGLINLVRQRALDKYGRALDAFRERGQKEYFCL